MASCEKDVEPEEDRLAAATITTTADGPVILLNRTANETTVANVLSYTDSSYSLTKAAMMATVDGTSKETDQEGNHLIIEPDGSGNYDSTSSLVTSAPSDNVSNELGHSQPTVVHITNMDQIQPVYILTNPQGEVLEPETKRLCIQSTGDGKMSYCLTTVPDLQLSQVQDDQTKKKDPQPGSSSSQHSEQQIVSGRLKHTESYGVNQAWFTTKDDKKTLHTKGHDWKQGQWAKEEVQTLQLNINEYCRKRNISDPTEVIFEMSKDERKDFYRVIAQGLNRPLFSVYRRVVRMYDQKNHVGKYTTEELERLRQLRIKHGSDWSTIGSQLGRSASSVKDRCRLMKDTGGYTGKWYPEEEKRLAAAIYELTGAKPGDSISKGLSWSAVAEKVLTRSEKQCRTKWLNYLNWKQKGGSEWTRDDDNLLINKLDELQAEDENVINWSVLCENWPSARSPQWLRGKWWSLKRHINDYQLLSFSKIIEELKALQTSSIQVKPTSQLRLNNLPRNFYTSSGVLPISAETSLGSEDESGFQAYELLETVPTSSGTYLITQPHNNPHISINSSGTNMATDHIIVHTLPSSTAPGGVGVSQSTQLIASNSKVTVEINQEAEITTPGMAAQRADHQDLEDHLASESANEDVSDSVTEASTDQLQSESETTSVVTDIDMVASLDNDPMLPGNMVDGPVETEDEKHETDSQEMK